jgi:integrase
VDPALGRVLFSEWVPVWEAGLTDLRPTTRELNLGVVRNHLIPRFGRHPLARITTADVKAMVADSIAAGASASATRRRVFVLRGILDEAVAEGRLGRNPAAGVKLPPDHARDMRFLDHDQVHQLAGAFSEHYRPLIFTAAYVGLRWGELAGLRVGKVDPLRRTIVVDEQLVEVRGVLEFGPPKTRAGVRTVSIPAGVAELIGAHLASKAVTTSGLVFPTMTGCPMRRSNWATNWRRTVTGTEKRPGVFAGTDLASLVFHELRHTAAALAIAEGAHPLTVKERLGHSSITTTMDTYGHLFPAQDEALSEGLDARFREAAAERMRNERTDQGGSVSRFRRSEQVS